MSDDERPYRMLDPRPVGYTLAIPAGSKIEVEDDKDHRGDC